MIFPSVTDGRTDGQTNRLIGMRWTHPKRKLERNYKDFPPISIYGPRADVKRFMLLIGSGSFQRRLQQAARTIRALCSCKYIHLARRMIENVIPLPASLISTFAPSHPLKTIYGISKSAGTRRIANACAHSHLRLKFLLFHLLMEV